MLQLTIKNANMVILLLSFYLIYMNVNEIFIKKKKKTEFIFFVLKIKDILVTFEYYSSLSTIYLK